MPSRSKPKLSEYQRKRDFAATREPSGEGDERAEAAEGTAPRFVVQEHHATRLHWDLRLEHAGALASWAIPNGIPPAPEENRLAVHTEDHPLEYLDFHGEIPKGQYGAGTMTIWDRGTYELHKWEERKVEVTFHGERLQGRYGLFPIGRAGATGRDGPSEQDWMIHRMDPSATPRDPFPERLVPMLARSAGPGELPRDPSGWSFEVKWDGIRAIAYLQPGRLRLESRNLNEITDGYPELRGLIAQLGMREAVLDGEIVAFDEQGRPSFEILQRRMHVRGASAVRRLSTAHPVVYAIFDLLYLDGRSLVELSYDERRAELEALGLGGPAWRVPAAHPGEGALLLEATRAQGLEGIVAKRRDSRYEAGRRTGAWLKIKHTLRQELVIGGWLPGEGRREKRIGALLMGYHEDGRFLYAGRVGTGFTEKTLDQLARELARYRRPDSPFDGDARAARSQIPREAVFVEPCLVAEIEFTGWTREGVMRAPSYKGLRPDRAPRDVVLERPRSRDADEAPEGLSGDPSEPGALFDEVRELPEGALEVLVEGRRLKLTNWDKVLYPATGFTKGDLIAFYARIAPTVVPHLHNRPLTLKRYPGGVEAQYFYEKQAPSHRPEWVATTRVGEIDYVLANDRATLVWLANLADIELHTSLSLAGAPQRPTSLVFDLDPGPPAGIVECCEVALVLHGLFAQLGCESVVKTSGSKGMQMYVPLGTEVTYAETKPFARRIAELLETRMPGQVVSRMTKRLRPGKVLVDWSQNDDHKTTVNVYSVRARERPTVSMPVSWDEVSDCRDRRDPGLLVFDTVVALERIERDGDLFAPLLSLRQELPLGR